MPCITLLSDFGLQDATVATTRGVLMQHCPDMPIVDISHEIQPFQARQAIYLLSSTWRSFPIRSCHVILFDLFAQKITRLLLASFDGHYFITADNGVVPAAIGVEAEGWLCAELKPAENFIDWLHAAGKIISQLAHLRPADLGLQPYRLKAYHLPAPGLSGGYLACEIIHIDHYENVVLNVTEEQFHQLRANRGFRLEFTQVEEITELSNSYSDARPGGKLCRFNNNGYLEIAVNRGNAASLFGLRQGSKNNDVKIIFE